MNKKQAQKIIILKENIETVERQIKSLKNHSFGFGTSYYDIDDVLRPFAKTYLDFKLAMLENELEDI